MEAGGGGGGGAMPTEHERKTHSVIFFYFFHFFFSSPWIVFQLRFMYISQGAADAQAFCLHTTSPEKLKKLQQ